VLNRKNVLRGYRTEYLFKQSGPTEEHRVDIDKCIHKQRSTDKDGALNISDAVVFCVKHFCFDGGRN
jgi:hypothetical protein